MLQKQPSALEEYDFTSLATTIGQTAANVVNTTKNFAAEYGPKAIDLLRRGVDATGKFMSTVKSAYSGEIEKNSDKSVSQSTQTPQSTPDSQTSQSTPDSQTPKQTTITPQQSKIDKPNNNTSKTNIYAKPIKIDTANSSPDKVMGQTLSTNALPVMRKKPPVLGQQNVNSQNVKPKSNLNINQSLRLMKNGLSPEEQDARMKQVVRSLGTSNINK